MEILAAVGHRVRRGVNRLVNFSGAIFLHLRQGVQSTLSQSKSLAAFEQLAERYRVAYRVSVSRSVSR